MSIPFFYSPDIVSNGGYMELDEENARHIVQVLRMKAGDAIKLTDGRGNTSQCMISAAGKKSCTVIIQSHTTTPAPAHKVTIAISLLKNTSRFEWFLEKAAEIGISQIIPIIAARTERQSFRKGRLDNILVSAMLQSQNCWRTELHEPMPIDEFWSDPLANQYSLKLIAHCEQGEKSNLLKIGRVHSSAIILIGPEGDFSSSEIQQAINRNYQPVSLGSSRLRTETAGIVAAALLKQLMEFGDF